MSIYNILEYSRQEFIEKLSNGEVTQNEMAYYVSNSHDRQGLLNDLCVEEWAESFSIPDSYDQDESKDEHIGVRGIAGKENSHLKSAIDYIEREYRINALPTQYPVGDKLRAVIKDKGAVSTFCGRILKIKGKRKAIPIANELIALHELGLANLDNIQQNDLLDEIKKIVPDASKQSAFNSALTGVEKRRADIEACKRFYSAFVAK